MPAGLINNSKVLFGKESDTKKKKKFVKKEKKVEKRLSKKTKNWGNPIGPPLFSKNLL
jgi:hypothetical protein